MFVVVSIFITNVPKASAQINPDTYKIQIVGDGTTYSKVVTIKAQTEHADQNGNEYWTCFSGDNATGQLTFNNTGQASYSNIGVGSCVDGWSYFQWDITAYDGDVLYGLKKVYIKLYYGTGNYGDIVDYTNRSVVYLQQPVPDPVPSPSAPPASAAVSSPIFTPSTVTSQAAPPPAPSQQPVPTKYTNKPAAVGERKLTKEATNPDHGTDSVPAVAAVPMLSASGKGVKAVPILNDSSTLQPQRGETLTGLFTFGIAALIVIGIANLVALRRRK